MFTRKFKLLCVLLFLIAVYGLLISQIFVMTKVNMALFDSNKALQVSNDSFQLANQALHSMPSVTPTISPTTSMNKALIPSPTKQASVSATPLHKIVK